MESSGVAERPEPTKNEGNVIGGHKVSYISRVNANADCFPGQFEESQHLRGGQRAFSPDFRGEGRILSSFVNVKYL